MMEVASSRDRAMICMPTGAGKTRTAVESLLNVMPRLWQWEGSSGLLAARLLNKRFSRFLPKQILAPRTPIYRFWGGKSPEIEYLPGGVAPCSEVFVTSTQQLRNRLQSSDIDAVRVRDSCEAVVIDEAHRNLDWLAAFVDDLEQRSNPIFSDCLQHHLDVSGMRPLNCLRFLKAVSSRRLKKAAMILLKQLSTFRVRAYSPRESISIHQISVYSSIPITTLPSQ